MTRAERLRVDGMELAVLITLDGSANVLMLPERMTEYRVPGLARSVPVPLEKGSVEDTIASRFRVFLRVGSTPLGVVVFEEVEGEGAR